MQVLFIYIIISFSADIILKTHPKDFPTLTYTVLSFFTIFEFLFFALFLFWVVKNKYFKNIIGILSILFLLFSITYFFLNIGKQKRFDSPSSSVESILIIVFCILFLFDQINNPEVVMIYESHRFWIITGFLIYMAGGFFLFIYADSFTREQKDTYWNINSLINIIKNLFIAVSFCMRKMPKSNHPSMKSPYNI